VAELVVVRHALAGSNRGGIASCAIPGAGLTPEGVEQACRLRDELADERIELAASSELARTQETLRLVLDNRDVPALVLSELNEIAFGSFDAGPLDAYRAWAAEHAPDERAPGGGESRADAAARFARALGLVLERPERSVLVVGHALWVRYVLDAADGLVPAALMAPVEHAAAFSLHRGAAERAVTLLDEWSRSPRFRDPPNER
jgi:broad specificity phosphatase PhoE